MRPIWQSGLKRSSAVAGTHQARHDRRMNLQLADALALIYFLVAWIGYSIVVERTAHGRSSLNSLMNSYRDQWMEELLVRPMRMVDAQVTAALQNGTAFFASTSLLAIGGALAMLRAPQEALSIV